MQQVGLFHVVVTYGVSETFRWDSIDVDGGAYDRRVGTQISVACGAILNPCHSCFLTTTWLGYRAPVARMPSSGYASTDGSLKHDQNAVSQVP
jgi:hypothetical protein